MKSLFSVLVVLVLFGCGRTYDASQELDSLLLPKKASHPKRTEQDTEDSETDENTEDDQ